MLLLCTDSVDLGFGVTEEEEDDEERSLLARDEVEGCFGLVLEGEREDGEDER